MLDLLPVPALSDNYIWILHDRRRAIVVDPGEADPVEAALRGQRLELAAIFLTHHHADHIAGTPALARRHGCVVHGPVDPRIAFPHEAAVDGGEIVVDALGVRFAVLSVPGHTTSHVAIHGHDVLFCGDTLFSVGCGRLFEGTAAQMLDSLGALAALPDATRVCCGHEYTVANCRFALDVDPDNATLVRRAESARRLRATGAPTLPTTIAEERATNPFLRTDEPAIRAALGMDAARDRDSRVAAFAALRARKDAFQ